MRHPPDDWLLADVIRRLSMMIRPGTVVELDETSARVKVTCGAGASKVTTTWLPWITLRAGPDRTWWALEPGEQVLVLSPSGDMSGGFVVGSIYQRMYDQPATSKDIYRVEFDDGTYLEHDRKKKKTELHVEGDLHIDVTGSLTWD